MKATRIIDDIWLGGVDNARRFTGRRLCVTEERPDYPPRLGDRWIPVLRDDGKGHLTADPRALDECAAWIQARREAGEQALVQCTRGIERGPFVMAYYLRSRERMAWEGAYAFLSQVRPEVQARHQLWMPAREALR